MTHPPTLWWVFDKKNQRHEFKSKGDIMRWIKTQQTLNPKSHYHIYNNDSFKYRCRTMKERGKYWR